MAERQGVDDRGQGARRPGQVEQPLHRRGRGEIDLARPRQHDRMAGRFQLRCDRSGDTPTVVRHQDHAARASSPARSRRKRGRHRLQDEPADRAGGRVGRRAAPVRCRRGSRGRRDRLRGSDSCLRAISATRSTIAPRVLALARASIVEESVEPFSAGTDSRRVPRISTRLIESIPRSASRSRSSPSISAGYPVRSWTISTSRRHRLAARSEGTRPGGFGAASARSGSSTVRRLGPGSASERPGCGGASPRAGRNAEIRPASGSDRRAPGSRGPVPASREPGPAGPRGRRAWSTAGRRGRPASSPGTTRARARRPVGGSESRASGGGRRGGFMGFAPLLGPPLKWCPLVEPFRCGSDRLDRPVAPGDGIGSAGP